MERTVRGVTLCLTYRPFAQFPSSATVHLGSGRSIPRLGGGGGGQIIANPGATHAAQSDDGLKDLVFCLRLSNEQACCVSLRRSHHQSRWTRVRLAASPLRLIAQRVKKKKSQYSEGSGGGRLGWKRREGGYLSIVCRRTMMTRRMTKRSIPP